MNLFSSFLPQGGARRIYLDYASAPPVLAEAEAAARDAQYIGNPGTIHREGVAAKQSLDTSRERVAAILGVKARELVFTGGLTEANNIAILGAARAIELRERTLSGSHWIVSSIEHASVLECFAEIERLGGIVTHVDPDERGIINAAVVAQALRPETVFVSVGWANNEIGTVQPLADIARELRTHEKKYESEIILHTDAGQALLYRSTSINSLGVDLLSIGGNKLYGPHGIGALFISNRVALKRVGQGGPQERGLRPGTENVSLAAGFAAAFEKVAAERESEGKRLARLRDTLARELLQKIPGLVINGDLKHALPHMLNISIPNVSSEYITLALDKAGIAISTKSACREGEESRSHVVEALGDAKSASSSVALAKEERAQNTFRISLGRDTSSADLEFVTATFAAIMRH